jgi:hypothetical protein
MIRWLAEARPRGWYTGFASAFRYLLMSSAERYLGHAIDRNDFERRLRVVRRGYNRSINQTDRL